jgi:DNA-directed RNA polymerase subunit F
MAKAASAVDALKAQELRDDLSSEAAAEAELRRQIAKAQRDLARAKKVALENARREQQREAVREVRRASNVLKDQQLAMADVEPVGADDLKKLSHLFNTRFVALSPDRPGEWYRVFRNYHGSSGTICYAQVGASVGASSLPMASP